VSTIVTRQVGSTAISELRRGKTGSATIFEFYGMHVEFESL